MKRKNINQEPILMPDGRLPKSKPKRLCNQRDDAEEFGIECTDRIYNIYRVKNCCHGGEKGQGQCIKLAMRGSVASRTPLIDLQINFRGGLRK